MAVSGTCKRAGTAFVNKTQFLAVLFTIQGLRLSSRLPPVVVLLYILSDGAASAPNIGQGQVSCIARVHAGNNE